MNNIYKQYLEHLGIPTEEDFVNVLNQLPEFEELHDDIESCDLIVAVDKDQELARGLFDCGVLHSHFPNLWIDNYDLNLHSKTVIISGINDLEELEEVKNFLEKYDWKLENYEEEKEDFLENIQIAEDYSKKQRLLDIIYNKFTTEQLEKIVNEYLYDR